MIKKITLTSGFILSLTTASFSQGAWTQKASLSTATFGRTKAASFELGGMGYVGTGYNGTAKNDFWMYDPAANTWTQKATFGGSARYGAVGFSVNGFGYIGTGYASPSYVKDMWKYDPAGNSWTQVGNFGGSGRMDAACFVIGNTAYVGTGYTGSAVLNDFWKFNPVTDTWTSKANYGGTACASATGFAVSGKGYFCCGRNATSSTYYNSLYQYDTTANTWTAKAAFSGTAREGAAGFVIGTNAYVGTGGSNNLGTLYNDFYKYDPVANSWSPIANFIGPTRSHTSSFAIGNYGFVGMGYTGGQVNTLFKYATCTGITSTITPTSPLCNGENNGALSITVTGAANPTTYSWSTGSTTQNITGLTAGNYSITITDADACTLTNSVTLTQPAVLTSTATSTNVVCNGGNTGSAAVIAGGGTSPYTYLWSPTSAGTDQTATGLAAGPYSVTITDSNGCTTTNSLVITEPTALSASVSSTYVTCGTCSDGTATCTVTGGTPGYTYSWNTTPPQVGPTATGLAIGTYTVCVIDNNGCTTCSPVSITYNSAVVEYDSPSISVYPNPSQGQFRISGLKADAEVSIYNCIGKVVYRTELTRKQELVNVSELPYGMYFLHIKMGERIFTKKITLTE